MRFTVNAMLAAIIVSGLSCGAEATDLQADSLDPVADFDDDAPQGWSGYVVGGLVEQLLALARSEAASIPAAAAVIDLAPIARAQVAEIFPQAISAGVELDFIPDNSPVRADPVDMAVLVRNLLDNAVRYAGSGASVRIETGRGAGTSWIQIEDSGPGMSDDELAHAFARFRRGALATERVRGWACRSFRRPPRAMVERLNCGVPGRLAVYWRVSSFPPDWRSAGSPRIVLSA